MFNTYALWHFNPYIQETASAAFVEKVSLCIKLEFVHKLRNTKILSLLIMAKVSEKTLIPTSSSHLE